MLHSGRRSSNLEHLMNNLRRAGTQTCPSVFCPAEVSRHPKCVYFEGNCIGLRGEIPPLLLVPWKISGRAIRGIDLRARPVSA